MDEHIRINWFADSDCYVAAYVDGDEVIVSCKGETAESAYEYLTKLLGVVGVEINE